MARPSGPATKVYGIRERPEKPSPYQLSWKYRGRQGWRSFTSKTEAERARFKLLDLIEEGAQFNTHTGWPIAWENTSEKSVAQAAHEWMWDNIGTWEPSTRRSVAEALANLIIALVRQRATDLPPSGKTRTRKGVVEEVSAITGMRSQIYDWLSTDPATAVAPSWVARNSLALSAVTPALCAAASKAVIEKDDGTGPKSPSTQARYRTNLRNFFQYCIEQKLLAGPNPWPAASRNRKRAKRTRTDNSNIRVKLLPDPEQAKLVIKDLLDPSGRHGRRARGIVLGLEFYAGLRPGEAVALEIESCELPKSGWGRITVTKAKTATEKRWMRTGEDVGPPKTPARVTTVPPEFVKQLRDFIGSRTTGLVAPNERGGMLDIANVNRTFTEACKKTLGQSWRQYDLRAARASLHANSGRAHAQVAREMGHSVVVLQSVYLGTSEADLARGLDVVESRLRAKRKPAARKQPAKKTAAKKAPAKKRATTTAKPRAQKLATKPKPRR